MNENPDTTEGGGALKGVAKALGGAVVTEVRMWATWAFGGAVVGGIGLGGVGLYLGGLQGLMWGAGGGAIVGAVLGLGFVLMARSESIFD